MSVLLCSRNVCAIFSNILDFAVYVMYSSGQNKFMYGLLHPVHTGNRCGCLYMFVYTRSVPMCTSRSLSSTDASAGLLCHFVQTCNYEYGNLFLTATVL